MLLIKQMLKNLLISAINELKLSNILPSDYQYNPSDIIIEPTKDERHGDYATNLAMIIAKIAKTNPVALAKELINKLPVSDLIASVEIAGPGFINFFLAPKAYHQIMYDINQHKANYGKSEIGNNIKVHMEYVSANPTGPLHVGHGRHAAFGSCVANLLEHIGFKVHREYYVNDAGRQMQILALSLWLRYLELNNIKINLATTVPTKAYQGDYVKDIAVVLKQQEQNSLCHPEYIKLFNDKLAQTKVLDDEENGDKFVDLCISYAKEVLGEHKFKICLDMATTSVLTDIKEDLAEFGVHYDNWFSEEQMIAGGAIQKTIKALDNKGYLYIKDDAVWFKTSDFGDEKDRVLIRANGQNTYFAPDIAYHLNKLERGSDIIIDILGADHHGYVPRLRACLRAFDRNDDQFSTKLVQFVNLYRGTKRVQMSTRSGSFITLRELRNEVGNDATRFFYIERKVDQVVDFDIELAKSQSQENPVYYIQYAHARICSIMRQLHEKGYSWNNNYLQSLQDLSKLECLTEAIELALLKHMSKYIEFIETAALAYEPHRVVQYLKDLAHLFHKYYNAHAILVDEDNIRNARVSLILAVKQILFNALSLLELSSPEQM